MYIIMKKKSYMVPETASLQFLKPMGVLMESGMGFGANNANTQSGDFNTNPAPQRKVF